MLTLPRESPHMFQEFEIYTKKKKKREEIVEVKSRRNITFLEARNLVESYMKFYTYANVVQRASPNSNNNNQRDEYRALVEKLMKQGSNDWPKFQE